MPIRKEQQFQYILCFGSRQRNDEEVFEQIRVSIHPMFRFKFESSPKRASRIYVSIHPMFRFKKK